MMRWKIINLGGGDLENKEYENPALTVDAVVTRYENSEIEAIMIKRKYDPWKGRLAFPGGFVEIGEIPEDAVLRELKEETSVSGHNPTLFAVHGDPRRDPRQHIVTIFYSIEVDENVVPLGGDDAAEAMWMPLEKLEQVHVEGDHYDIIKKLRKEK